MARAEVEALRAQVRQQRKRATAKAGRLRREQRAHVAGTKFDPRRNVGAESRMNEKQLRAYLGRLQGFNSRGTQFVGGAAGTPLPRSKVMRLYDAQGRYNATRDYLARGIKPGTEAARQLARQEAITKGMPTNTVLGISKINPRNIMSEKALDKYISTLERRMTPQGTRADIRKARATMGRLAEGTGLGPLLESMSDSQVAMAFSSTNFMNSLTTVRYSDKEQVVEQQREEMTSIVGELKNSVR